MQVPEMSIDLLYLSIGQRFGPQKVAVNLLNNIMHLPNFSVIAIVDKEVAESLIQRAKCRTIVVDNTLVGAIALLKTLLRWRPKIVHFNFIPIFVPLLLLMKLMQIKIVYSFHGGILLENRSILLRKLFLMSCKFFYDVIIANSEYSTQLLIKVQKGYIAKPDYFDYKKKCILMKEFSYNKKLYNKIYS